MDLYYATLDAYIDNRWGFDSHTQVRDFTLVKNSFPPRTEHWNGIKLQWNGKVWNETE